MPDWMVVDGVFGEPFSGHSYPASGKKTGYLRNIAVIASAVSFKSSVQKHLRCSRLNFGAGKEQGSFQGSFRIEQFGADAGNSNVHPARCAALELQLTLPWRDWTPDRCATQNRGDVGTFTAKCSKS